MDDLSRKSPSSSVTGFENDPSLFQLVKPRHPRKELHCEDFLQYSFGRDKYSLIIGNPPFFELQTMKDKKLATTYRKKFSEVCQGRVNIFTLFVKKCIDLLAFRGVLCLIVPNSLKSASILNKLRRYLVERCELQSIENLKKFAPNVEQTVMMLVCQRRASTGKFVVPMPGMTYLFSEDWESHQQVSTLTDYRCTVKTGTVVWNEHREELTNDSSRTLLVYSDNLGFDGELHLNVKRKNKAKKQYIVAKKHLTGPCILISRTIGTGVHAKMKCALFRREDGGFLAENHVNVISSQDNNVKDLELIFQSLMNPRTVQHLRQVLGTVNLSKANLLHLPIFTDSLEES